MSVFWYPGWPFAAKSIVQHEFDVDHLNVWLTFSFPMNQSVKPDDSKWSVFLDDVEKVVASSSWQDCWTLLLVINDVVSNPSRVLVSYDGPGPTVWSLDDPARKTLEILWRKQWEGWGPILSQDIGS